jgi:hypothetical protein
MKQSGGILRTAQKVVDVVVEVSAYCLAVGILFQMEKNNGTQR